MVIPKIIHQVWEGKRGAMPARLRLLAETWKEKNPEWEYHLWNGEEMEQLVSTYFSDYLPLYNGFSDDVQRWDTIRYMILYMYGGVYTDLDTECFRAIDPLFKDKGVCFGAEPNEHALLQQLNVVVGNAFMSSDIKNPVWLLILKEISEAVNQGYTERNIQIVLNTTGPLMISRIVTNLENGYDITILSSALVAPFTKNEIRRYVWNLDDEIIKKKSEDAFCAHYFFGSWNDGVSIYIK